MLPLTRHYVVVGVLLILATYSRNIQAQDISEKFGQISMDEMTMTKCPGDTSAEAYILYDKGISVFQESSDGGFDIFYDRHCRIKILSENGYDYANIEILLYQENNIYEKLESVEAYTYNLNGSMIERTVLDPKNIYQEKVSDSYVRKKFAFPKVKVGSVIEFKYRKSTPYVFNLPSWQFQHSIPVRYSEYEVHMIPFYIYTYILQGSAKFDFKSSEESTGVPRFYAGYNFHDMVYIYGMKNLPAFREESFLACPNEYIVKLVFQLSTILHPNGAKEEIVSTWSQLEKDILKNEYFGKFLRSSNSPAKKIVESMNLDNLSAEEKVKTITEYVKQNFRWNELTDKFTDQSVKKFLDEKSGNSVEINLFLVSMLNAAGIESYPLLISTRNHGQIRYQYPFLHYFNDAIAVSKVNSNYLLTDGTDPNLSYTHIPLECINDKGLIIKKEEPLEWVNLSSNAISLVRENIDISLSKDVVNASLKLKATDYDAYDFQERYSNKIELTENDFLKKGYTSADSIEIDKDPVSKDTFNLKLNLSYKLDNTGNFIYLSPLLEEPMQNSPFKSPDRTYPVDFNYLRKREYSANINIPEGYTIQSVPAKLYYDNKDYYVFYEAKILQKGISVTANYMFKRTLYQSNDYKSIRFIMQNIVDKFNEKIILKKVG